MGKTFRPTLILLFSAVTWVPAVPKDGLVLYLAFDDQGTAVFDSALGAPSGDIKGGASLTDQGKHGKGYLGPGPVAGSGGMVGPTIEIPNRAGLNPTAGLSVAVWAYTTQWTGGNRRILQKSVSPQDVDNQYRFMVEGQFAFDIYQVGRVNLAPPSLNVWHHLAGTYDGSMLRLYVDGQQKAAVAAQGSLAVTPQNLFIASKIGHDCFAGRLDDVLIYNRALTVKEIEVLAEITPDGLRNAETARLRPADGAGISWYDARGALIPSRLRGGMRASLKIQRARR